jgi:two-component system, OmpR family, sensor kinase
VRDQPDRAQLLTTLERLLEMPSADLSTALALACDAVAEVVHADKVDAFLLDSGKNSLVAVGTSNQPLSNLQRNMGLDVLSIANGGRVVHVFETKKPYRSGRVSEDPDELKGIRDVLKVESQIGTPIEVGGEVRGVLMIASQTQDFFTEEDERFLMSVTRWVGAVAHRAELVQEIAKNALEQGRRAVAEELVTVLAHDLRNVLAPISTHVHLIRYRAEQQGREADVRECDAAVRGIERLARMITDILDVARLDQGVMRLDIKRVELGALATDVARTLSTSAHEVRVAISENAWVLADPERITQCLENLVTNAVTHSPRGAPVVVFVGTRREEGRDFGSIDVVDEGPGVPVEILPRVFERFSRGRSSNGLGLGLYLARRIAVAHAGDISIESTLGKGARFRLLVPMYRDE